jgi:mannobiose 2-epimerase
MNELLIQYRLEMEQELQELLQYWSTYTTDKEWGGFVGQVDMADAVVPRAPKGVVLNARILWSFAAAFRHTKNKTHLALADRAMQYILEHFLDNEHGGAYWMVDHTGLPLDRKKQVYAIAFVIYALSEYHRISPNESVKDAARKLYELLLVHAYDKTNGGFIEALSSDWQPIVDRRLSDKDANTPKSMNTMLHVLEGFTNIYRIWPNQGLRDSIRGLLKDFDDHIINERSHHLDLFFENDWSVKGHEISFGHDIEASWLLQEAAEVIEDTDLIQRTRILAVSMARAAARGLDSDGGLLYEFDTNYRKWIHEKHWWPQAEGMVGFLNAFQLTGDRVFLQQSLGCWNFVKARLKSPTGEWYWGIATDGTLMEKDKVGPWKCPYHNSRACMEVIRRIDELMEHEKISRTETDKP